MQGAKASIALIVVAGLGLLGAGILALSSLPAPAPGSSVIGMAPGISQTALTVAVGLGAAALFLALAAALAGLAGRDGPRPGLRAIVLLAPLGAILCAAAAAYARTIGAALAKIDVLTEYTRNERLLVALGVQGKLLVAAAAAVGVYLVALVVVIVRGQRQARPGPGLLLLGAGAFAVAVAPLGGAIVITQQRLVAQAVVTLPQPPALELPLRHHPGGPLSAETPRLVMRLSDGVVDVPMPPSGTRVVELAIDERHPYGVASRLLEALVRSGVERIRPIFRHPLPDALQKPMSRSSWLLGPLVPPTHLTLQRCEIRLLPASQADSVKQAGLLVTPPSGESWRNVTRRLGQLETTRCSPTTPLVLAF